MKQSRWSAVSVAFLTLALLPGCGWLQDSDTEMVDEFPELGGELGEADDAGLSVEDELGTQLSQGDRFPLRKTVEQSLVQYLPSGPKTSTSRVELSISVSVDDRRDDGSKLLGIRYLSVGYEHDFAGERVSYRSETAGMPVPPAALAYDGLVGNGFQFWLDAENRVQELLGFDEFLSRCVARVPPAQQQATLKLLAELHAEGGLASFVDTSIGMLPAAEEIGSATASSLAVGASWTRKHDISRPLPMRLVTKHTVREIDVEQALIDVRGEVQPPAAVTGYRNGDVDISARGGKIAGQCTIDRLTGLPVNSHIDSTFVMNVRMPDGMQFEQHKRITTTVEMDSPTEYSQFTDEAASSGEVVHAGGVIEESGPQSGGFYSSLAGNR